jgi:hypothetical protein
MDFRGLMTWKTVRFVAITVVLGAIGSGIWEWMLKPMLMGASQFGLNVATLGVHSFKNSLYKDIAHGFHEESSLRLYLAIFGLLPCFILGVITGRLYTRKRLKEGVESTALDRVFEKLGRPMLILFVFLLVFSVVQANQVAYINRAVMHFNQLLAIASPHIREEERLLFQSQFAQVASSEDYAKLITTLIGICRAKGLNPPEFSVW